MSLITDESPRDCSSYKHQHHHRAIHGRRISRRTLVVASSAVVSLASLSLILWLVLRPSPPRFSLLAATTTANDSASVVAINAAFAARNPNSHTAVLYDRLQASASYAGLPLTAPSPLIPPFLPQQGQGDAMLSASLTSPPAAAAVAGGRALLRLRVEGQLRWKVAAWVTDATRSPSTASPLWSCSRRRRRRRARSSASSSPKIRPAPAAPPPSPNNIISIKTNTTNHAN